MMSQKVGKCGESVPLSGFKPSLSPLRTSVAAGFLSHLEKRPRFQAHWRSVSITAQLNDPVVLLFTPHYLSAAHVSSEGQCKCHVHTGCKHVLCLRRFVLGGHSCCICWNQRHQCDISHCPQTTNLLTRAASHFLFADVQPRVPPTMLCCRHSLEMKGRSWRSYEPPSTNNSEDAAAPPTPGKKSSLFPLSL